MMKHFLWCLGESQGVTIAFFDCIGRCVGTAPPTLRFAASTCGFHRSGLRWFSPLGATFRFGDCRWAGWFFCLPLRGFPRRVGLRAHCSAFRHAPLRSCRSVGWPSGSRLPLFGTHRFGVALGELELPPSVSEIAARRVGLRTHGFRFSACAASELPLGELAFGLTTSAFRHAPLWGCRSAGWPSGSRLPLFGTHRLELPLGELVLPPSVSEIAARRVGLRAHDFRFRHAPLRGCPRRVGSSAFRFGDCHSAGWPSGSRLPLFGTHRFGVAARRVGSAAFRFGVAARRVGLRAHGFRFSACADPHRRTADARIDGAHRHDTCFTSKHLSQHVNLPHRSPQALQNRQTPLLSPTRHPRG